MLCIVVYGIKGNNSALELLDCEYREERRADIMTASAGGPTSSDWPHHQSVCLWRKLCIFITHPEPVSQDTPPA